MATIAFLAVEFRIVSAVAAKPQLRRQMSDGRIRLMGPQIGVEVSGVDVKTLDERGFAPIYQAWLDCNVMCVRDQELTIPDFIAYSRAVWPGRAAPVEIDAPP